MYKCKVVSLSLVYCCHYFIIILLILLFSIIFCYYFGYNYVYFSVILLCHFALCSSWLCCVFTLAALCPSYHLYYVLLYNLCCVPKGFPKMEKKNWIRLVQKWLCIAILHVDMQNGYKKTLIFDCERFKMGKKNKRLLNLSTSLWNFLNRSYKLLSELTHTWLWITARRQHHPSLPVELSESRHSPKNFTGSTRHHFMPTGYWQRFSEMKLNQNNTQTVWHSSTGGNLPSKRNLSRKILSHIYSNSH